MNQILLRDVGLTERQKIRVVNLLTAWGIDDRFGSDYGEICKATGQINKSPMSRFKKDLVQNVADSSTAPYIQEYNNDALKLVRDIIYGMMPNKIKKCLIAKYRWRDDDKSDADKIEIMDIPERTYYDRIRTGHEIVSAQMDWSLI